MGGYAIFVWPAYAIALGLTFFLYKRSVKQLKHAEKQAKELGIVTEKVKSRNFFGKTISLIIFSFYQFFLI